MRDDRDAARAAEAAVHRRDEAVAAGDRMGRVVRRGVDRLVPHPLVRRVVPGTALTVDSTAHSALFYVPDLVPQAHLAGVTWGYPWRAPNVGEELPVFMPDAPLAPWVEPPPSAGYWLYYQRFADRLLARVDWPPVDGAWENYTVGTAPIEHDGLVGWVLGTLDDGATVVVGFSFEFSDEHPRYLYGVSAADLTTVLWGPRAYPLLPLNDDETIDQPWGKATPDAGLVTTAEWVRLPTTLEFPDTYQFAISHDALATVPPTFYSPLIVTAQDDVSNVNQIEAFKHFQVMNAWGSGAEQIAVWAWSRSDERHFASGEEWDVATFSWYLYTSIGGADVVEQQLSPPPGGVMSPDSFRSGYLSGALGYADGVLTVYLNMDLQCYVIEQRYGRVWAGRFTLSGSTWVQQGDWETSDLDMMHVASPDGVTGWGAEGYHRASSFDAEGWPEDTPQWYTVDYGATWLAMPEERPPGCPYPLGSYGTTSANQTRVAIVAQT